MDTANDEMSSRRADGRLSVSKSGLLFANLDPSFGELFDDAPLQSDERYKAEAASLESAIASGDVEARWRLGRLFEDGRGVERDLERARELYARGAENDEPNALAYFGYCNMFAVGAPYDAELARTYLTRALKVGGDKFESRDFACGLLASDLVASRGDAVSFQTRDADESSRLHYHSDDPEEEALLRAAHEGGVGFWTECALELVLADDEADEELRQLLFTALLNKTLQYYLTAAKLGNGVAAWRYGKVLAEYATSDSESRESGRWTMVAARRGCVPSYFAVATTLEANGRLDEAQELYAFGADYNLPEFACKAAVLEMRDPANFATALERFKLGAEAGHHPSEYFLGMCYWKYPEVLDRRKAAEYWRRSAEGGFAFALERYAEYIESGEQQTVEGVEERDMALVAKYRLWAAAQGYPPSKLAAARQLYNGEGVKRDYKRADALLLEVEQGDDASAKEALADMLFEGDGCDRDAARALRILEDAAKSSADAQVALGFHYFIGDETRGDYRKAAKLFGAAAAAGRPVGMANFSRCCREGLGVKPNPLAAEFFLRCAASAGEPVSAFHLAEMFALGAYLPQNWVCAAHWYAVAAERGDVEALGQLAFCYWKGLGVERDRDKAIELWTRAAECGNDDAREELNRAEATTAVENLFIGKLKVARTTENERADNDSVQ